MLNPEIRGKDCSFDGRPFHRPAEWTSTHTLNVGVGNAVSLAFVVANMPLHRLPLEHSEPARYLDLVSPSADDDGITVSKAR